MKIRKAAAVLLAIVFVGLLTSPSSAQATSDSVVRIVAESQGLSLVPANNLPKSSTFWVPMKGGRTIMPMPWRPEDPKVSFYAIAPGQFLVAGGEGDALPSPLPMAGTPQTGFQRVTPEALIQAEVDEIEAVIAQVRHAQANTEVNSVLMANSAGLAPNSEASLTTLQAMDWGTNLWLGIPAVTNGSVDVILHNVTQGEVYELMSTPALPSGWNPEQPLFTVADQDWIEASVPILDRTNALFFQARDWTGIDENTNGIPDWWEWQQLGTLTLASNADFDCDGYDILFEYEYDLDPNKIQFSFNLLDPHVGSTVVLPIEILCGAPSSMAVVVDTNDFAGAAWTAFSSNPIVNLGTNEGSHYVWVGLRGRLETSQQTWQQIYLDLDVTPPVATSQFFETSTNKPIYMSLRGMDPNGYPVSFIVLSGPTSGILGGTAPDLTYTPNPDFEGLDSFVFKVNDGVLDSAPATITLSVSSTIEFSMVSATDCARSNSAPLQMNVTAGVPRNFSVLLDNTNFAAAVWQPYVSSNMVANLGTNEGWHEFWVGLRGTSITAPQAWRWMRMKLDATPPLVVVTNPADSVISQSIIQLRGLSDEPLQSLTYDLVNATNHISNEAVPILDRLFDTNVWEYSTSIFQAFDVPLATGTNVITLHAVDLAGNATNLEVNVVLDYSSKTNPPVMSLYWPRNGAQISGGSNCTWRGWVDDPTAKVMATLLDAAGNTNILNAVVERDGKFWVENVPLLPGANTVQILAQDAAGNVSVTNLAVTQSSVALTIGGFRLPSNSSDLTTTTVWGSVGMSNCVVWVNGVPVAVGNAGSWTAENVPVPAGGTYLFQARAIPNADNGGNGDSATNGVVSYSSTGNPGSSAALDTELQSDKGAQVYLKKNDCTRHLHTKSESTAYNYDGAVVDTSMDEWKEHTTFAYADASTNNHETIDLYFDHVHNGLRSSELPSICRDRISWGWDPFIGYGSDSGIAATSCNNGSTNNVSTGGVPVFTAHCDQKRIVDTITDTYAYYYSHTETHYDFERHTSFKQLLLTGGKSVIGGTKLFLLTASAAEELWNGEYDDQFHATSEWTYYRDRRPLPKEQITVGSFGNLGSEGYIAVNLGAGETVDVTPDARGIDYWSGGSSAGEVKMRIFDASTGVELTDKTNTVMVGQKISLYCSLSAWPGIVVTNFNWNVPGYAISNYVATTNIGLVYPYFPKSNTNVAFYWADGANGRLVTCMATVNGKQSVGGTVFNVLRPEATLTADIGTVHADTSFNGPPPAGDYWLYLGGAPIPGLPLTEGIVFEAEVSVPTNGAGQIAVTQLINTERRHTYDGTNGITEVKTSRGDFVLDGIRGVEMDGSVPIGSGATTNLFNFDSPATRLSAAYKTKTVNDTFKLYLKYKPAGTDSIWVTLRTLAPDWKWRGSATKGTNAVWTLGPGAYSASSPSIDSTEFPVWILRFQDLDWRQE